MQTPQLETNLPGQSSISYRTGTWTTFKESMLARLSSSDYPALAKLTTRDDDDFTIALLDATSVMLDILTFYNERLINEGFLRTAVQQQSLVELSRLIGYQPSPGVSSSVWLAFTLQAVSGQPPNPSNPAITIPQGTQVQSVPAQGQTPQTFETSADILAKSDWNALPVQTGVPWKPPAVNWVYLSGTSTRLNPGDSLLILGVNRETWNPNSPDPSEQWDVVVINQVSVDSVRNATYVTWDKVLTHESGDGTSGNPSNWTTAKIFAFRQKAALFGHNAPNPSLFVSPTDSTKTTQPILIDTSTDPWQWFNYQIASSDQIDLDATYSKIVPRSWFALTTKAFSKYVAVLDNSDNLWMEPAPLGSQPASANILVDRNTQAFQALSVTQIFVLGNDGNLWLERAPFGTAPPARVKVDGNVRSFQALSATQVFVLGKDGNLWLESAPFGKGIPARVQVDTNVAAYQAMSPSQVFVLDRDGNLWLDRSPFGTIPPPFKGQKVPPPDRLQIDAKVQAFQAGNATELFVLRNNGDLMFEEAPFGPVPPKDTVLIFPTTSAIQAVSPSLVYVLWENYLILVQFEPDYSTFELATNVQSFRAVSSSVVLFTDTSGKSWLAYGPPGSLPSTIVPFDAKQAQNVPTFTAQLFEVERAVTVSLANFGLSGKVTELAGDYKDPSIGTTFGLQATQVWAQSDELGIAEQPLDYPLYGSFLDLHDLRPDLAPATAVVISGNRQKITVATGVTNLVFHPEDDTQPPLALRPEDTLTVTNPSPLPLNVDGSVPDWSSSTATLTLNVEDSNGRPGTVLASLSNFTLAEAGSNDPEVTEFALVASVETVPDSYPHTRILLHSNLANCYDRTSTTVNANVGLATQGQSVTEIMGNGNAATPNQTFTLRQSPLTLVQAPTPSGRQSTLQVQANGVAWTQVPTLYGQSPSAQVFATLNQTGGVAKVLGGDGVEGATFPTGQNNLRANYRIGIGSAGNVAAGSITSLVDRPLGVSGVTNPSAATGGQDSDSIDNIRSNAPQTVMTLGRAVSITDYQSYASTFAGISQAYAVWIPTGPARGVFLTVAAVGGSALPPGNPTLTNLATSLKNYGNPLIPITAVTFLETLFGITADLQYAPNINTASAQAKVKAQVLQALYGTFSLARRTFGQGVSADEVAAVIQGVPGIVAVNVTDINVVAASTAGDLASLGPFTLAGYNNWLSGQVPLASIPRPSSGSPTRICPYLPVANPLSVPLAAEILVLDPDPKQVNLGVMS